MLYDPGGTCTVLAYRPVHFCLRPKLGYQLPLVVLSRLNRFTLSHYGSRTPLSTLHAGLTASHARLSTGCLLGFAGSGLSPDYTVHAELAHNFRTLKPQRGLSIRSQRYGIGFLCHRSRGKWTAVSRQPTADRPPDFTHPPDECRGFPLPPCAGGRNRRPRGPEGRRPFFLRSGNGHQ